MSLVDRFLERLAVLAGVLLLGVAGVIGYEVIARYVFNAPTTWTIDIAVYLTLWATFLGAGYTLRAGGHIRMDLYVRRLSQRRRPIVDVAVIVATLSFCALWTWQGIVSVADAIRLREVTLSTLRVPLWVPLVAIPVGGAGLIVAWLRCLRERRVP